MLYESHLRPWQQYDPSCCTSWWPPGPSRTGGSLCSIRFIRSFHVLLVVISGYRVVTSELDYSVKKYRGHHSISFGQIQLINDILYSKRTERGRDVMFLTKLSRWRHLGLSSETILFLLRLRIFDGLFLRFDARVSISTWHIIEKGQREQLKDQPKEKHHNDDQVHRPNHRYQYSMRTFVLVWFDLCTSWPRSSSNSLINSLHIS